MAQLTRSVVVRGEIHCTGDLTIDGTVEGPVWAEGFPVTVGPTARVTGDIVAREITIFGQVSGALIASDIVDIRPDAIVTGRIMSQKLVLAEGGSFTGAVQPQQLFAALEVARHRRAQSNTAEHAVPAALDEELAV